MNDELFYRANIALLSTVLLAIRLLYGWRARRAQRRVLVHRVGALPTALLYVSGGGAAIASLVYVIAPQFIAWATLPLPAVLRGFGILIGILVIALFFWTHRALGENWAMPGEIQERQTLVVTGPYRWVRHPMYATLFPWTLAYFLISANALVGGLWLALAVIAVSRIGAEEASLVETFGDAYRTYMQGTGRLLPRVG